MGALLDRFSGDENKGRLLEAVCGQDLVANDAELAEKVVAAGELQELAAGAVIIKQGDWDDDLFLILAGQMQITAGGP